MVDCVLHNNVWDTSGTLGGQQMLRVAGAAACCTVWMCERVWGRMSRMHAQECRWGLQRETRAAEMTEPAQTSYYGLSSWLLAGSGCFTLGTVADVKFHGNAFPWPKKFNSLLSGRFCSAQKVQQQHDKREERGSFLIQQNKCGSTQTAPQQRLCLILSHDLRDFVQLEASAV